MLLLATGCASNVVPLAAVQLSYAEVVIGHTQRLRDSRSSYSITYKLPLGFTFIESTYGIDDARDQRAKHSYVLCNWRSVTVRYPEPAVNTDIEAGFEARIHLRDRTEEALHCCSVYDRAR